MTWAVTLDFHNTIARCDEWFQLEVYDLVPAYLGWSERKLGQATSEEHRLRGKGLYRALRQRVVETGLEIDAAESLGTVLNELGVPYEPADLDCALVDIFRPTVEGATPIEGVIRSVDELHRAGVRLGVVSSAIYHPFLEWTLEKFGISDCFHAVMTSASLGHYKSTPKIYASALETLGVQPERCIHIGDSERYDVQPAKSLGIRTVLLDGVEPLEVSQSSAELRLTTLADLPIHLRDQFGMTFAN